MSSSRVIKFKTSSTWFCTNCWSIVKQRIPDGGVSAYSMWMSAMSSVAGLALQKCSSAVNADSLLRLRQARRALSSSLHCCFFRGYRRAMVLLSLFSSLKQLKCTQRRVFFLLPYRSYWKSVDLCRRFFSDGADPEDESKWCRWNKHSPHCCGARCRCEVIISQNRATTLLPSVLSLK